MRPFLIVLCLCLAPMALSAQSSRPSGLAGQDRVAQAEAKIETVDRDVAILKQVTDNRLDAQDQRIGDLNGWTEQQANHMAAISNVTAWVATLITLIAVAAGFIIYFSMKGRASAEAREAAKHWFFENTNALHQQIDTLRTEAETLRSQVETLQQRVEHAHGEIDRMTTEVDAHAKESRAAIDEAAQQILAVSSKHQDSRTVDPAAIEVVRQASVALQAKPENSFTSDDHFARGLSEYTAGRFESALSSFDKALELAQAEAISSERYAKLLFARANALAGLERNEDAIAVYNEIDQRYGTDMLPALRERVAKALVNKGVGLGQLNRNEEEIAVYDQIDQRYGTEMLPALREQVAKALFNKGISLDQLDCSEDAIAVYDQIDQRYGTEMLPALREQVAKALFNKGVRLGQLYRREEEIAVYDLIDQRYGADALPTLREQVAKALVNRAFLRMMEAKQHWQAEAERGLLLAHAIADLRRAKQQCANEDAAMVLGSLGYALFLSAESDEAEMHARECLRLGREASLEGQRDDAKMHRVEPQDSDYERLLDRLWEEVQTPD
jgi:tetratricopeptide (TPR) repeat protein